MKVYVCAPYAGRPYARLIAEQLIASGFIVTSGWVSGDLSIDGGTVGPAAVLDTDAALLHAVEDLSEVGAADVVLALTGAFIQSEMPSIPDEWLHTGGRHVEIGFAIAKRIPVVVLGEPENLFQRTMALCYPTLDEALVALKEYSDGQ